MKKILLFCISILGLAWGTTTQSAPWEAPFVYTPYNLDLIDMHFILRIDDKDGLEEINKMIFALDSIRPKNSRPTRFVSLSFDGYNEEQIDSLAGCIWLRNRASILELEFFNSPIKRIPRSVSYFPNVQNMNFLKCDSICSMNYFDTDKTIFGFSFYKCNISKLPEGIESISPMLNLEFDMLDTVNTFDIDMELRRFERRNNVLSLLINNKFLKKFPESIFRLTSLQTLVINVSDDTKYPNRFNELINLKYLCYSENKFNENPFESAKLNGIIRQERTISSYRPDSTMGEHEYYNYFYTLIINESRDSQYSNENRNDDVWCKQCFSLPPNKRFTALDSAISGDSLLQIVSSCIENTSLVKLTLQEMRHTTIKATVEVVDDYGQIVIKKNFIDNTVTLDLSPLEFYAEGSVRNFYTIVIKYNGKRYKYQLTLNQGK